MNQTTPTPTVDTRSETWKHQCLVRWILKRRAQSKEAGRIELFGDGKKWLGWKVKDPKVYEDVLKQWRLGNRGKQGEWYD